MSGKRTQQEIVERIEAVKDADFFGVMSGDLLSYLDFEHARAYLVEGATADQWREACEADGVKTPDQRIRDYMPFAWEKANNCRGLSASRTIDHMRAWLWLDGVEWFDEITRYSHYGKPQLVRICEHYGIDWQSLDDGSWRQSEMDNEVPASEVLGRQGGGA